jgi:lysyl-tRNA synthetase, class I
MTATGATTCPRASPGSSRRAGAPRVSANQQALWSDRLAEKVAASIAPDRTGQPIVCASGISPSGPIHMGNLREVFTTHLVVEALRTRGHEAVHLHSWDDYDRLRRVPAGVDPSFERYVGMPLSDVPDPRGNYPSWAERHMSEFLPAIRQLGIEMTEVRQSERYRSGLYNAAIRRAMEQRGLVFDTLAEQQTAGRDERPIAERRREYFPFKPYCEVCGRDDTRVTAYETETVRYTCRHGHKGAMSLADGADISGKLVWKVDWPMRWHHEGIAFEPAGEDHHAPTGSATAGQLLVQRVFGGRPPESAVYSFVSLARAGGKMSSSSGMVTTPQTALSVLEPAIVRWLYIRRLPHQSFAVDLTPQGVPTLYDEWDRFVALATAPDATPAEAEMHRLCVETTSKTVCNSPRRVSFRLLASVADITQANCEQMGRIIAMHVDEPATSIQSLLDAIEPRLGCAIRYATELVPSDERTVVREAFSDRAWEALDERTRLAVETLSNELSVARSHDELTKLVYSIPRQMLDLPAETPPSPELKHAQREFFKAVYLLLLGKETGPRLPTLLLSIGSERARRLLGQQD